jgi:hypothetical protein
MIVSQPRNTTLVVMMSSLLLGSVVARADRHMGPSPNPPAETKAHTDDNRPPAQDADADTVRTEVGSAKSNVDKDSTSGSYYPYSAGTVGDDPAEPTSTAVTPDAGDKPPGPTDQWGDIDSDGDGYLSQEEMKKAAPALSASFEEMDVDADDKLTRGEFRTWHESRKARENADKDARSPTDDDRGSSSNTRPDGTGE